MGRTAGVEAHSPPYHSRITRTAPIALPEDTMETNELTAQAPLSHAHHWVIEEASGPISSGRCKSCGAGKAFKNWLADSDFTTNEEHRTAA